MTKPLMSEYIVALVLVNYYSPLKLSVLYSKLNYSALHGYNSKTLEWKSNQRAKP